MANMSMSQYKQNGQIYVIDDPTTAPVFVATAAYKVGQYVKHEGVLCRFKVDHPAGAWDDTHVYKNVLITNELNIKASVASMAKEFAQNTAYASGTYIYYQHNLYQFTSAHTAGAAWSSSIVRGPLRLADEIAGISLGGNLEERVETLETNITEKVSKPESDPDGTSGQVLRSLGNGATEWVDFGLPSDEQTATALSAWMSAHPEAITDIITEIGEMTGDNIPIEEYAAETIKDVTDDLAGQINDLSEELSSAMEDQSQAIEDAVTAEVSSSLSTALGSLIILKTYTYTGTASLAAGSSLGITAANVGASTPTGYSPVALLLFTSSSGAIDLSQWQPSQTSDKFLRIRNGGTSAVNSGYIVTIRVAYMKSEYVTLDPS